MAKGWMNTLKGYFSMLNQLQIEGDVAELASYRMNSSELTKEYERILRGRETYLKRNAKPLKCKTTIRNIRILSEEKNQVQLALHNHLWKLYRINQFFLEQEDEQYRLITLKDNNGDWLVENDSAMGVEELGAREQSPAEDGEALPVFQWEPMDQQPPSEGKIYNRAKAKRYAEVWWNHQNPNYPKFEVDCTNFVSQCLHEGGLPMESTGMKGKGWWVQGKSSWSFSWSVAHSLMIYLLGGNSKGQRAELKESADQLMIGDVICYDWDGSGQFQHNTIVVAKDPNGMPLVNAHTVNSRHRYWEYRDSYAWTPNTQYKFIHIKD